MSSQWTSELVNLRSQQEKINKQISLLEELIDLESQHAGDDVPAPVATRKAKSRATKPQKAAKRRTAQAGAVVSSEGKNIRLPQLLINIGQQLDAPAKLEQICALVKSAGYESNASDFSNMVYQGLQKLIKKGVFARNSDTREYAFTGNLQTA